MIRLHVKSLSELREKHQAGDYVSGTVFSTPEGSFTISLYPTGDKLSNPGFIGVYLTCLSLKNPALRGVRVGATWNLLSEEGVLITSRHEKLTPILLTPDPGEDPQLGKGRGYTNFYRPPPDLETFTLTCDFVVREVVREDAGVCVGPGNKGGEGGMEGGATEGGAGGGALMMEGSVDGLLATVRRVHERELERSRRARVLAVEELVELTQEDLLKLQENLAGALTKKCEMDRHCSICLERQKDHVCVPCGHRYCGPCIAQVDRCAECRERISQKLKCF
ncbi:hypothetical protein NSK_003649 [Nannochloropsis salina CCMP1776]|uniref:RING-type domain-containing protein n=1 Tax=Nannochloropsis salina CCMP1776 TaxID=1027361 RepID=A0A4D9D1G4_9STRA|nr:hypothetical protein NSK_003649 [Nannochloropsis salina CCMP1776]|eukprot:TFJ85226.1 hypothetical protein NSK_003649 [Nannochloropsis salina CCMP1776]